MTKNEIKTIYKLIAKKEGKTPSYSICKRYGITEKNITKHFKSIYDLQKACNMKTRDQIQKDNIYRLLGVRIEEK